MLSHLGDLYDERNSGICLVRIDGKYQLCTREEYADDVRALLEIKKNTPLSQAAFEVLAIVAYNKSVTKSFIEKGRLDLPGRPLVYGTTDRFLRCFSLNSLDDLPELPSVEEVEKIAKDNGQTSLFENDNNKILKEAVAGDEE